MGGKCCRICWDEIAEETGKKQKEFDRLEVEKKERERLLQNEVRAIETEFSELKEKSSRLRAGIETLKSEITKLELEKSEILENKTKAEKAKREAEKKLKSEKLVDAISKTSISTPTITKIPNMPDRVSVDGKEVVKPERVNV
jgi:septal ring factor EnvC (AmiA/AmiB activator)